MSRPALLIIDMMNRFDYPGGELLARRAVRIVPAILRLRQRFDVLDLPVIYANDNFMDWQADFGHLVQACQAAGGASGRIASALEPASKHYYLLKPKHSAFLGTPLEILLAQLKVNRLVLSGIATDSCIVTTAQDGHMRDFDITVAADATDAQYQARKLRTLALLAESQAARTATAAQIARTLKKQTREKR